MGVWIFAEFGVNGMPFDATPNCNFLDYFQKMKVGLSNRLSVCVSPTNNFTSIPNFMKIYQVLHALLAGNTDTHTDRLLI
jgi:hypothetical protein